MSDQLAITDVPCTDDLFASPLSPLIEEMREGVMLLDRDGALRWANRAALAMHGITRVDALGASLEVYRQRFQLRFKTPHDRRRTPVARLLAGEPFDDVVVDIALSETPDQRRVHRVRGRVLSLDATTHVAALIIEDITELASAEERFETSFSINPAPALICRLRDQRFVRVNDGFLEMTGLAREAVLGRSLYELDVFAGADQRDRAIRRLEAGLMIAPMEAVLHPGTTGESKCVVVAGQPIEVEQQTCMLLTFTDLEPARRARSALRRSEAQFSTLFHMSPVPTVLADHHTLALLEVNDAFNKALGYAPGVPATGALEAHAPLPPAVRRRILAALEAGERLQGLESNMVGPGGEHLTWLISATMVSLEERDRVLLTLVDITERKRSEAELFSAIDTVMQDASWFTRTLVDKLASVRLSHAPAPDTASPTISLSLSLRERDVLALLCQGLSDKRIAGELSLAHSTVRNYVASLYRKLEVHSRSEAIIVARRQGLDHAPTKG
ncbi:helix-turn-helix transcriptional regulator [Kushneria sp. AK178]